MEGVIWMSGRARGGWWRLVGVAVALAVALPPLTLAMVAYYVFAWLAWPLEATPTPSDPSVMVCAGRGGCPDDPHREVLPVRER